MELTDKDLTALANVRLAKRKEIRWNRKYTIPFYICLVIMAMSALIYIPLDSDMVLTSEYGHQLIIVEKEWTVINGIEFNRDRDKEPHQLDFIPYVAFGAAVLCCGILYKWAKDLKQPYVKKFIEHYREHGELMK